MVRMQLFQNCKNPKMLNPMLFGRFWIHKSGISKVFLSDHSDVSTFPEIITSLEDFYEKISPLYVQKVEDTDFSLPVFVSCG